ncbi:maestro heat-like repeat family member 5 [Phasianus colchicus]|uniref:maestro heat-like repeat family member 5 n=1 Tax=Phasianus colchicus TaxID=9054 RepID=UPI00129EFC56|nr:maestro heat-like repeat family member 5 [Phasianus colchicus]
MRELPGALRDPIFYHLVELLSTSFYSWEMVAMVFLVEMLERMDVSTELRRILRIFTTYLHRQSVGMQQLVLRGMLHLSKRRDTARVIPFFLPCIMDRLQDADSDVRAVSLQILSSLLQILDGFKPSFMALELAGKLPTLLCDESSTVRQLSIDLFFKMLSFAKGHEKKTMQQEVYRSLVLLYLHLHDEEESVIEASRNAFLAAARFLRWRRLEHLVQTAQFWQIGECLLAKRKKRAAQDYLSQSLLYLRSPQEALRREAVRFIGLLGQHLTDQQQAERQDIYDGLQGAQQDPSPFVSSLALQTLKILKEIRPRPAHGHFGQLVSRLRSTWRRWHSDQADS